REIVRAFHRHPVIGRGADGREQIFSDPEKTGSKRAEEPFVAGADEEIGDKSYDVDGDGAAALADVEKKQCALPVAGFGEARNVQHGDVVEADVAGVDVV